MTKERNKVDGIRIPCQNFWMCLTSRVQAQTAPSLLAYIVAHSYIHVTQGETDLKKCGGGGGQNFMQGSHSHKIQPNA